MIIEFSVKNFRSIKDLQTISFAATGLKSPESYGAVDSHNVAIENDVPLLKTLGIYGANGSGKSNIIRALDYFIDAIRNEASTESQLSSLCDPFLYQSEPSNQESFFQIIAIIDNKKYRYGFTVKRNQEIHLELNNSENLSVSKEIVVSEWLFGQRDKNTVELFTREDGIINKERLGNTEPIPDLTTQHNLFLTYASAFDQHGVCAKIRKALTAWTISNLADGFVRFRRNTLFVIEQENRKEDLLRFLSEFNLKYDDIEIDRDSSKPNEILPHEKISFIKTFVDSEGKERKLKLNLRDNESSGTQKLFDLAGVFLRAFNMNASSGLIVIDEIDSHFHPSLLLRLINFINNSEINPGNTQLIFTSHDTNLLSPSIMRRDQFYFSEKRQDESSRLYSLADLRGIRNDADFAKQYLAGYYGAVPILEEYIESKDKKPNKANGSVGY